MDISMLLAFWVWSAVAIVKLGILLGLLTSVVGGLLLMWGYDLVIRKFMAAGDLRTSADWYELCNVRILDPDGWRGVDNCISSWRTELISRQEFENRLALSTCEGYNNVQGIWKDQPGKK